jgi:hypothetical protein
MYETGSDGRTSTTQRIGSTSYTTDSDGNTRICQTIGSTVYCN